MEIHGRVQCLAAIGQPQQATLRHRPIGPALGKADAGLRHSQEQAREVSAVHRGNIGRLQNGKRAGVVPVEQVAVVFRQLLNSVQSCFQALDKLARADPAEFARATDRK